MAALEACRDRAIGALCAEAVGAIGELNAATLDRLLRLVRQQGYRFVSLDEAQSDPAYRESPRVATKYGPMWGYRWASERQVKVDGSKEQEPPEWVARYAEGM